MTLAVVHQERLGVVAWRADGQHQVLTVAHSADLRGFRLDGRACIEYVDVALIAEPLGLEHGQRRLGVRVHTADHGTRIFGEKAGVKRKLGHQLGNEGLVTHAGEVVGLGEFHLEEMPAEAFPER